MQFGFDFGNEEQNKKFIQQWNDPKLTFKECSTYLDNALIKANQLDGVIAKAFVSLIDRCIKDLAIQNDRMRYTDESNFSLWVNNHSLDASQITSLLNSFENDKHLYPNAEFKIKRTRNSQHYSVYIDQVGSFTIAIWEGTNSSIRYVPWRSANLNVSHTDHRKWIYAPANIWDSFYCADKIAESYDKTASVDSFKFDGREYINDGGSSKGEYRDCLALTFVPRKQWHDEVFTYSQLRNKWDEGTIERGDQRGMLIKVRGFECVIDGSVMFYDDQASKHESRRKGREAKQQIETESIF